MYRFKEDVNKAKLKLDEKVGATDGLRAEEFGLGVSGVGLIGFRVLGSGCRV